MCCVGNINIFVKYNGHINLRKWYTLKGTLNGLALDKGLDK